MPLQGVKVLDFTEYETSATEVLAWYGADVIKIERPDGGDPGRRVGVGADPDSPYFVLLNCNKRSVTLNLEDERGRRILRQMIPKADVFVENLEPGAIDRLGFSYQEVSAINPGVIYARIRGFGSDTPWAQYPCSDTIAQAMGGSMSTTGCSDGPPLRAGPTLGETGASLLAISGILAALWQRYETGRGQCIEVAMHDAVVNFARIAFYASHFLGEAAVRSGNEDLTRLHAPANAYQCKPFGPNDYVCIYASRAGLEHWERLLQVIGREDLKDDPRFNSIAARKKNTVELDRIIGEWMARHTKQEVMRILGEAKVPAGMVLDTADLRNDPYLWERGMFVTVQHPTRGPVVVPGWPVMMSDCTVEIEGSPLLGQHNAEVYDEWLGLNEGDLEQLRAKGII